MRMPEVPREHSSLVTPAPVLNCEIGGYDILVLDAASRQSLAAVRSLGRAGLRVATAECFVECDPALPVLGFRSRYSARSVVLPSFASDSEGFAAGVLDFVRTYPTRVVLPTSDGSIAALTSVRYQLAEIGCALALPSENALEVTNNKDRTLTIARELGIEYPKTIYINDLDDIPAMLAKFRFPIVLKPTISWAPQSTTRLLTVEVIDEAEAVRTISTFRAAGAAVLAQEWVSGRREGVTMFVVDGEVRVCCAHAAYRTVPQLGGASVLRESLTIPQDIYDDAVRLVKAIGLNGVCEVEFRRDADGRPLLMEINARLAGTIENAVRSGIDFPLMIWQWATGQHIDHVSGYETGVRTRYLRGDMRWLRDNYHRVGRPDSVSRARSLWMFATEFCRTIHYDCLDYGDLGPVMAELRTTTAGMLKSRGASRHADLH